MDFTEDKIRILEKSIPYLSEEAAREAYQKTVEFNKKNNLMAGNVLNLDSNYQELIEKEKDVIEVFLTKDKTLSDQYYSLRKRALDEISEKHESRYPNENLEDFLNFDQDISQKQLVVVTHKEHVVGGGTLTIYDSNKNNSLIQGVLDERGLGGDKNYAMYDNLVTDRSFRSHGLVKQIFSELLRQSKEKDCVYLIGFPILTAAINHRILLNSLGYECDIIKDHPIQTKTNSSGYVRYPIIIHIK